MGISTRLLVLSTCLHAMWPALLLLCTLDHSAASLPRGGGDSTSSNSIRQFLEEQTATNGADASSVTYPPLSKEEIGESLQDVPIFYIERKDGGGILVAGGNNNDGGGRRGRKQLEQKACYFFLEKEAALANLDQVMRGGDDDGGQGQNFRLQVSTTRLGQMYEKFWHSSNSRDEIDEVQFRLVAINEELLRARFLLTVTPNDLQKQLSEEEGRRLLAKVNAQPKRFKGSFDDVPLFLLPQLRLKRSRRSQRRKRSFSRWPRLLVPRIRQSMGSENECLAVPLYFTFEDMKKDLERAMGGTSETGTCIIMNLGELLKQMGKESRGFDYRDVVFVPPGKKVAGGTPMLLDGDTSNRSTSTSSLSTVTDSIQDGTKYVDGGSSRRDDYGESAEDDRIFWLRPRRRIRQRDLDALFGPDQ